MKLFRFPFSIFLILTALSSNLSADATVTNPAKAITQTPPTSPETKSEAKDGPIFFLVGQERLLLITLANSLQPAPTILEVNFKSPEHLAVWKAHRLKQTTPLTSIYTWRTSALELSKLATAGPFESLLTLNGDLYFGRADFKGEVLINDCTLELKTLVPPPPNTNSVENITQEGLYYRGISDGRYWYLLYLPRQPIGIPFVQALVAEADTSTPQQPESMRWWIGRVAHREAAEARLEPGFTGVLELIDGPPLFFRVLAEPFFQLIR